MVQMRRAMQLDSAAIRALVLAGSPGLQALGLAASDPLVGVQHRAQEQQWKTAHAGLERWLVVDDEDDVVGRCYLAEEDDGLRVVELTVRPERRGQGIGTQVLGWVHARAGRRPVTLHVDHRSRARDLYLRLGYVEVARDDVRARLERRPEA